ncbi:MAG: DUF4919 domain-containing protein [Chitinophagales bacterium]|nr:DUF4919 domain-containing protein [Chitinophagales bacterium]
MKIKFIAKIGFCLLLAFTTLKAQSASAPKLDFEAISYAINDPQSPFYYPALFVRYEQNDTQLTLEDYVALYYGFAHQPNYHPLYYIDFTSIEAILYQQNRSKSDQRKLLKFALRNLKDFPFDLEMLWMAYRSYESLGKKKQGVAYYDKFKKIVATICLSGDGLTPETAYHVLFLQHEYMLLDFLGFRFDGQQKP